MNAILVLEGIANVDQDKCLGCGVCAPFCIEEAINIKLREDREEAFGAMIQLGQAIIEGKKKG